MPRTPARRLPLALALALVALLAIGAPAPAAIFAGDPVVGPTPALRSLGGLDLAPDGTGAMAYVMQDGGVDHVFASRLVNGAWSAPERLDAGGAAPSSQPVLAAGDGGRVAVAFVQGGDVVVATRASAGAAWTRQTVWGAGGASSPAIDLSVNGKGYLAFAAPGAGGRDVRVAFSRDAGPWSLAGAPLDASPGDDAGAGTGRPQVAASADGTAIAVWGEAGHVFARRVRGTAPSVVFADANAGLALEGVGAGAADEPVVSTEDDDSFTAVAFRATFLVNGATRTRAVYRRLRGSRFEAPSALDALPFASGKDSGEPRLATIGTGQGLALGSGSDLHAYTMVLKGDSGPSAIALLDAGAGTQPPLAVPAAATARKMLVAWQLTPAGGAAELRGRYYADTAFGPEQALSKPQYGSTLAERGLAAAGDDEGDLAVAFMQDVPGQGAAIAVATVDQPPGRFAPKRVTRFQRTQRPVLSWTTSTEAWGRYFRVTIDGVQVALTGRRSLRAPVLAQGAHTWQVTVLDRRGQQYVAPAAIVRVDTVGPRVRALLHGARRAGATLRLSVHATDKPATGPGAPAIAVSGLTRIVLDWGDGTLRERIRNGARHAYRRAGRYVVRVVALDQAGNRTTVRIPVRVAKPPRRHRRGRHAAR